MFITLEGIEGVGKTTHAEFIVDTLKQHGHKVTLTREPGGTEAGEAIRELLLNGKDKNISDETELLLIFAARAQHLHEVIRPALSNNKIVVCDRFTDATYAYQGGGRGIKQEKIRMLEEWIQNGLRPDLTMLFDAPVATGLSRANSRNQADRFESETVTFFEKVRKTYHELAIAEPARIRIFDAEQKIEEIQKNIVKLFTELKLC